MTRARPRGRTALADEQGAVALLVLMAMFVLSAAGLVVLGAVTDLAVTAARARTAADSAALAAVGATPLLGGDGDTCAAASDAAEANNGRLVRCESAGAPGASGATGSGVLVEVAVAPDRQLVRTLAGDIQAKAAAGLRPTSGPTLPVPTDDAQSPAPLQRPAVAPD
ncbi:MAG: hypothetical protein GEU81_01150 [Nitriliruptorales bacterium]|nr:hypothetical protein [Nitriliruptorales bacterium]